MLKRRSRRRAEDAAPDLRLDVLAADPPPAAEVVAVRTDVGELLLHAGDEVMTPIIQATGRWEEDEVRWMRGLLRPGQTVVDCGANVGYFSVLAAAAVGSEGHVVAFEPERANLRLLRHNLWRNGADNVRVVPAAAADRRGAMALRWNASNRGDHQVHPDAGPSDVLVEFWLDSMEERGVSPADVLTGYRALGRPIGLLEAGGSVVPASDDDIMAAAMAMQPYRWVNIVLGARG